MCPPIMNSFPTSLHPLALWVGPERALTLGVLLHALNLHWSSILHGDIHVSMLFSQIIPLLPSPTESKSLFFTSVSLAVSHIGHRYHLSKFRTYVLIYCIGAFLSDLLHSV